MAKKTDQNYAYPIVEDWSMQELIDVTEFFRNVERAYDEHGVNRQKLLDSYAQFQEINPARTEQNQLRRDFEKDSGLDIYQVLKNAQTHPNVKNIKQID
ncbi:UPF0223 family protein [Fructilactobacillus frigidiflavus]|uniref:UPF0223 family protein n=1 Tax=Fructilactobacillus frigidiflavus TaxID=3242688 RepID=UPI0037564AB2